MTELLRAADKVALSEDPGPEGITIFNKQHSGHWPLYGQVLLAYHMSVYIVGTGHYVDGFCWFLCICILSMYLGPYQRLARPDILPLLTIWYW